MIHSRTSRVYIILERDSVEGWCMQMSDKFCVMHLKYLSCGSLHIVMYCGEFVRDRVTAF